MELDLRRTKPQPAPTISINAPGGAALVNIGAIYGTVQQVIGTIENAGAHELAELLERLATAIRDAEALGDKRAAYLEQVEFIAQQAAQPEGQRKASLVSGMFSGLQVGLQTVVNIGQIFALLGPALAQHFGFHWPV